MFAAGKSPKPKKAKPKGRTDEELFGNTDDIFGGIPSKPKQAKAKKTKKKAKGDSGEAAAATNDTGETVEDTLYIFLPQHPLTNHNVHISAYSTAHLVVHVP